MITVCAHDGESCDTKAISMHGFQIDEKRDSKEVYVCDRVTGEKTDKTERIFDFVGFVSNAEDELLVVFPKHYRVTNEETDARRVFACIAEHMQKKPELYIGADSRDIYRSNFPFAAFFGIYEYFAAYGLYFRDETFIRPNTGGRISWKETISRSEKYMAGGNIILFPLYYRKNYHFSNFVTECMIFAIDYTIQKFGIFIDAAPTGEEFPQTPFLENREYVVTVLQQLRQQTFKDNEQRLIDHLTAFFSGIHVGGSYYLKHYAFSAIWEDMVTAYLCKYYKGMDAARAIVFDKISGKHLSFAKRKFYPNQAKPAQYIEPDHYAEDGDIQLIFDAKYYTYVRGMDYKQIAYVYMLRGRLDPRTGLPKFRDTYSALILPAECRDTKIHFQLAAPYGVADGLLITEEYLDISEVMAAYLQG